MSGSLVVAERSAVLRNPRLPRELAISPAEAEKTLMRLRAGAVTDVGRVRRNNEDAYGLRPDHGLFVVCDGMGGTAGGEVASRMAVDTIVDQLNGSAEAALTDSSRADGDVFQQETNRLGQAVRHANAAIFAQARQSMSHAAMGTTVVAAWVHDNVASVAHVGDSRAYLWHSDRLEPLTRDHSLVEEQVRAGLIDRDKSLQSEQQNILFRALGREQDVEVDLSEVPLQSGDYLVLCSDGLTRIVPEPVMAKTIADLRDPRQICEALVAAANNGGGPDNITVVVVQFGGSWWRTFLEYWKRQP